MKKNKLMKKYHRVLDVKVSYAKTTKCIDILSLLYFNSLNFEVKQIIIS